MINRGQELDIYMLGQGIVRSRLLLLNMLNTGQLNPFLEIKGRTLFPCMKLLVQNIIIYKTHVAHYK